MKSNWLVILASALVLSTIQCDLSVDEGEKGGGWVRGIVGDAETGSPLDSVLMKLTTSPSNDWSVFEDAYSDSDGYYLLYSGVRAGMHYAVAIKDGYERTYASVIIIRGDTATVDLEMEIISEDGVSDEKSVANNDNLDSGSPAAESIDLLDDRSARVGSGFTNPIGPEL